MNKTFLMFRHEFVKGLKSLGFLILTFSVPVTVLLGIGVFNLAKNILEEPGETITTIGYVDQAEIITITQFPGLVAYPSKAEAKEALILDEIAEYFIIPDDYLSTGHIERYTLQKEGNTPAYIQDLIWQFLKINLLSEQVPPEIIALIVAPPDLEVKWVNQEREVTLEAKNPLNMIIPGVFGMLLAFAFMFGTTTLVNGLGEEKESQLIEVLLSSVSAQELLISKVVALGTLGLIQVLVWIVSIPFLLNLASSSFGDILRSIEIPASFTILGIIYFVLGYFLFAILSIGVGAISANATEGSSISMLYTMTTFIPLWVLGFQAATPNHLIWVALMFFPTTAPIQTIVRLGIIDIPLWQIIVSISIMLLSIAIGFRLAIRIFSLYMLSYGKRPGLKKLVSLLTKRKLA